MLKPPRRCTIKYTQTVITLVVNCVVLAVRMNAKGTNSRIPQPRRTVHNTRPNSTFPTLVRTRRCVVPARRLYVRRKKIYKNNIHTHTSASPSMHSTNNSCQTECAKQCLAAGRMHITSPTEVHIIWTFLCIATNIKSVVRQVTWTINGHDVVANV